MTLTSNRQRKLSQMNTWSTEKFHIEKSGFHFPCSSVWNLFVFSLVRFCIILRTRIHFFLVDSCGKIPRLDNELSVGTVLLTVMKV